jgi:hypothetical protein
VHSISASVEESLIEDGSEVAVKKDKKKQMKSPSKSKAIKSMGKATSSPTKKMQDLCHPKSNERNHS